MGTNMSLLSTLIIACSLSSLVLSSDYGMEEDKNWPTTRDIGYIKTPRPTKWAPPKYDDGKKSNWQKPSYPKAKKPSPSKKAWKKSKDLKPTWKKNDHESYEKETVSHIYNPYDIRQRGIVKAQLEERIESDMQELAALDALELETVSD